ncbi:hypothetical protein [Sulfodiicoccus acidiphilus]|nr:hypothetical protein [Sulfodiicoccus acidiphilus]
MGVNMDVFRYAEREGLLFPDPQGSYIVAVDGDICLVDGPKREVQFAVLGTEEPYLKKLTAFSSLSGMLVDVTCAMAVPDSKARTRRLARLFGQTFEDYVFNILSANFIVEKGREIRPSLAKFTGERDFVRPDFVIEGIAVEAKVGSYERAQLDAYASSFRAGVLTTPFSSRCDVPRGWVCVCNLVYNPPKLVESIRLLKERTRGDRGDRYTSLRGIP